MAEKKINGRTFKTAPLLATQAMILQARLLKALGPLVPRLADIFAGHGKDTTEEAKARSNAAALEAFSSIFSAAEPEAIAALIKDIVEIAMIKRPSGEYSTVDFDGDFTESLKDTIPVVVFVLREQFGDFFTGLLGSGGLAATGKA